MPPEGAWNTVHVTTIDLTAWCFLRTWFQRLLREGHGVTLVTTAGEFAPRLRALGVEVVDVPIPRRISPRGDWAALKGLVRTFRGLRPDIVHTHTSKAGFLGRLAARLAGVPRVVHTMHEPPHNAARGWVERELYIWLERLAARWADRIHTQSHANEREILRTRLVPKRKLEVFHLGIDLSSYRPAADPRAAVRALGIPDSAPVVGTVGRLEAPKGHAYLLQALARLPARVRAVIVGGGVLRERLEADAETLGVADRVVFTGFREDMLDLLQGFDVFALPSLWEGLGVVLLEAMAYGKPLVASAVGGVTDVVVPGETGLLVPREDPKALAQALARLLDDRALAQRLGAAGRARVERAFRSDVADDRFMRMYRELL